MTVRHQEAQHLVGARIPVATACRGRSNAGMGLVEWSALSIGAALVAWPVFQMQYGKPQLSFAFDRAGDQSRSELLINIYNRPIESAALVQMGVRRDDAHFSVSLAISDERGNPLGNYDAKNPNQFHLDGGHAPITLRILACDAQAARIDYGADTAGHDLKPGTYTARITARLGERSAFSQRMFVVTQQRKDSYWADA
jgi:hypothetical protein